MKFEKLFKRIVRFTMLTLGACLAGLALEVFLVPQGIIDGGIVGISLILAHITPLTAGVFIIALNIPFLFIGYKNGGKKFVVYCIYAIVMFTLFMSLFEELEPFTNDVFLSVIFGGLILGIGVGLIIKFGGSLDGTEMLSIMLSKNSAFSVGQFVMFCNVIIFSASGFVFGWDKAMYSLITYFVVFKIMDIVIEGINETKSAFIITEKPQEVADVIMTDLGRSVTFIDAVKGYSNEKSKIIYVVLTLMELSNLKDIVKETDKHAFVTISDVSDIVGRHNKHN